MPKEGRPTRVLLVMDDEHDFRMIRDLLLDNPIQTYELEWMSDHDAGLEALTENAFNVCLLDCRVGTRSGLDLLKKALSIGCATPVILLTNAGDHGVGLEAMQAGAVDYLSKNEIRHNGLERSIRHSIDRREMQEGLRKESELRLQAEKSLSEQLRFQTVLAEISSRFINLPPEQVDLVIEEAQRMICDCLDLDRVSLWQASSPQSTITPLTHLYQPLDGPTITEPVDSTQLSTSDWAMRSPDPTPVIKYMHGEAYFPWLAQKVMSGVVVLLSKLDDLPIEASVDKEFLRRFGTKSTAVFPLMAGGGATGAIAFDSMREERDWPQSLVKQLSFVTEVFANAIARAQADRAARESEEQLNLAAAAANAGLWSLDVRRLIFWVTDKTRELLGIRPDDELTLESFLELVHPEDRNKIRETVLQAIQSGQDSSAAYRIVLPDGTKRWMASRGRIYRGSYGEPDRLMGVSSDVTEQKRMEEQLEARLQEIEKLKKQLEVENIYLREEVKLLSRHDEIVAESGAMQQVLLQVEQVAPTGSTVLITGETGTGKGLIAQAIHRLSPQSSRPLVTVNCASLPPTLIESELFGREKGAYTGAMSRMVGRFEISDGGTLFLDEIGDLPIEVQAKLLRVLESGCFERLGSSKTIRVKVRLLAATNRDLDRLVREGKFRNDLYYRLKVFPIKIPPLRQRPEDIPPLMWTFVRRFEKEMGKHIRSIQRRSQEALQQYPWPGNARELRNVIEHAMIVSKGATLEVHTPGVRTADDTAVDAGSLQDVERKHILEVLQETRWRISGKGGAAEILGLKPTTLESRLKKLGIHRSKP